MAREAVLESTEEHSTESIALLPGKHREEN
jgi:hypothetical protein